MIKEKKTEKKAKESSQPEKRGRLLKGVVVSDKMDKTIVVLVDRYKEHPKYKKRYRISKKYKVDDPKNRFKIGDKVAIEESRPISKGKRWSLREKS